MVPAQSAVAKSEVVAAQQHQSPAEWRAAFARLHRKAWTGTAERFLSEEQAFRSQGHDGRASGLGDPERWTASGAGRAIGESPAEARRGSASPRTRIRNERKGKAGGETGRCENGQQR